MARRWRRRGSADLFWHHARAAGRAYIRAWRSLFPDAFWEHRKEAHAELRQAVQVLIDTALVRMVGAPPPKKGRRRGRIDLE